MSAPPPQRRAVRVRRSPKVWVFLAVGVLVGVLVAVVAALVTPASPQYPTSQVLGFLVLLLAPIGAVLGGIVAIAFDVRASRRARVLEAERVRGAAATPEALSRDPEA